MKKKNSIAKDLRTPKYKPRVVQNKKRKLKAKAARRELREQLPSFFIFLSESSIGQRTI